MIYRLFFAELPAGTVRELAWTEQGSGALIPGGGVGALAIGGWFLHRGGMSLIERSSALFFLASAVNAGVLILAAALLASGAAGGPGGLLRAWTPMLAGLLATGAVVALALAVRPPTPTPPPAWLVELAAGVDEARSAVRRPSWRLLGAIGYLGFDIGALAATFAATGHALPAAGLVLGSLIGYLANVIPVPGGFGVLEGGLARALVAYGAPVTQAAAAVVVYHAIALLDPGLGGMAGYARLRRRLAPTRVATAQPYSDRYPTSTAA